MWLGKIGVTRDGNSGDRGFIITRYKRIRGHAMRIPSQATDIIFRYSDPVPMKCNHDHHFLIGYNEALAIEKWTRDHNRQKFYLRNSSGFKRRAI